MVNTLAFVAVTADPPDRSEIRPVIDNVPLFDDASAAMGLHPESFDAAALESLVPSGDESHRVVVGRCACGSVGCGSVDVLVSVVDNQVVWSDWGGLESERLRESFLIAFRTALLLRACGNERRWGRPLERRRCA